MHIFASYYFAMNTDNLKTFNDEFLPALQPLEYAKHLYLKLPTSSDDTKTNL